MTSSIVVRPAALSGDVWTSPHDDGWWETALSIAPTGVRLSAADTRYYGWWGRAAELLDEADSAHRIAVQQGFVLTRAQAVASGHDAGTLRRLVRSGRWTAPRRGILCPLPYLGATEPGAERPHGGSPEIVTAATALLRPHCVVSHQSAAGTRGVAVLVEADRPRLTTESVTRAGTWPSCHIHAAGLPDFEVENWFGTPITSVPRTVVDLARHDGIAAGLVAADSALQQGLMTAAELARSVRAARRRPGVTDAATVADLTRPGAESPLESLTRLCLIGGGLDEEFVLQAPIETSDGQFRVDLLLPRHGVVIEADGQLKYGGEGTLWKEKLRQEALERLGYRVVRVTWDDVMRHPERTVWRVRQAIAAQRR